MALFKKKNGDPVAEAESKVQALRERGEALQAQHARVATKLAAAVKERDGAVLDDEALERAGLNVASAEAQMKGIDQAISENQRALAEAESALAAVKDRAERERKAKAIEAQRAKAEALMDRYLEISREFSEAMLDPTLAGEFHSQEIGLLVGKVGSEVGVARPIWRTNLDNRIAALRAEPEKPALQSPAPPVGEWSPHRRQFSQAASPGAIGDTSSRVVTYHGAFAEK